MRADEVPPLRMRVESDGVLVANSHVTAEVEYEPIRAGLRTLGVALILDTTRLNLNIEAARAELKRLEDAREQAKGELAAVQQPRTATKCVKQITTRWKAGSRDVVTRTVVVVDDAAFSDETTTRTLKRPAKRTHTAERVLKQKTWSAPWTKAEKDLLDVIKKLTSQIESLRPAVGELEDETGAVPIRTEFWPGINRRLYATSLWMEHLPGDKSVVRKEIEPTFDAETGEQEGPFDEVTYARGRIFTPGSPQRSGFYSLLGNRFVGVDVRSSMFWIMSVLLGMRTLEARLSTGKENIADIVGPQVWPLLERPEAIRLAKTPSTEIGYAATPTQVKRRHELTIDQIRVMMSAIGQEVFAYHAYTRAIAKKVDPMKGFVFHEPLDGVEVVWRPINAKPVVVSSDRVQITTYVPTRGGAVDRGKLARQLPVMLVHMLDGVFAALVVEELYHRGVEDIVSLWDSWLVPERFVRDQPKLWDEVLTRAGELWLPMLGPVYEALLTYDVPGRDWMLSLQKGWQARVAAKEWPKPGTKPVIPFDYE